MAFEKGDRVVTPSGEIAKVVRARSDGRFELQYVEPLVPEHGELVLPGKLLRQCIPGISARPFRIREE